jgi:hypothetical protein
MTIKKNISKELLLKLYVEDKLSTFQIADKLKCCQATVWKRLRFYKIESRLPGIKRVNLTKEQLESLYLDKKLSTWKIEKILKIPRGTIYRKLKEYGIISRDRSDSHIIHLKNDFSCDLLEKAYLIGFRIGDLGVRRLYPNSKTICVASGSTKIEQITLIKNMFKNYSKVWIKQTDNGKINIQIILNESFNFLLDKKFPLWILEEKKYFFSFLAGFSDAEGCISKQNKIDYFSLGNYDKELLFIIHKNLNRFGIICKEPYTDNRKGKSNNQGYKYNSNYSSIRLYNKENLLYLLNELKPYIKHKDKVKALNMAILSINSRNKLKSIKND